MTGADAGPPWPGDRGGHRWPKDREVVAADGARIRYTVRGAADGPWVVLCSGFLCPDNFWAHVGERLMERHRVVVLNYRGIGASTGPRRPGYRARHVRAEDYTIERCAGDVAAVLAREGVTDATLVGHSMGCQVALQTWRTVPERVAALVCVTGPYASPFRSFYGSDVGATLFPLIRRALPLLPRPVQRGLPRLLRTPAALPVARLVRALGPLARPEDMRDFLRHVGEVDPVVAVRLAEGMHAFDAGPWLHEIDVPVLVVVGSDDRFSPPEVGAAMAERLPDAELVEVAGGSHAVLLEYPDEVVAAIDGFLRRRLAAPADDAGAGGSDGIDDGTGIDDEVAAGQ